MCRDLSPFIRHLGEAKYRSRILRHQVEQLDAALLALAGGRVRSPDDVLGWIDNLRTQLACAERQARAFVAEQAVEQGGQGRLPKPAGRGGAGPIASKTSR